MHVDKSTFCAAPWFQIRNENSGQYRSCCEIDHSRSNFQGDKIFSWPEHLPNSWNNSDYVQYLRKELTNGTPLPECHKCWKKEAAGQQSLRQIINRTVTNNQDFDSSWLKSYFRHKHDHSSDFLLSADVKITNLCNFGCVMCDPESSSYLYQQWSQNKSHPVIKKRLQILPTHYLESVRDSYISRTNYDLLEHMLDQEPRYLKILGGEPLIDPRLMKVLCSQSSDRKSKIKLYITTNGSQDLVKAHEKLQGYREINWIISLESVGKLQDYARKGSNWSIIEKNIDDFIKKNGNTHLYLAYVIQSLTLMGLPDLLSWAHDRGVSVSTNLVVNPDFLGIKSLPTEMKKNLIEKLKAVVDLPRPLQHQTSIDVNGLCGLINSTDHDRSALQDLREWVDWYDPEQQWREIIPEWLPYFETGNYS